MENRTYLALGDSYTIGEAVDEAERWPVQLVSRLNLDSMYVQDPFIIATTGWTTDELIAGIAEKELQPPYDLVSLLIGVNNQYRGYDIERYKYEFAKLLEDAIKYAGNDPSSVFVLSIPDYGVTPFSRDKGLDAWKIHSELVRYNEIADSICQLHKVDFINITEDSRLAATDRSLVAKDGLHPSGKMYASWVEAVFSTVKLKL